MKYSLIDYKSVLLGCIFLAAGYLYYLFVREYDPLGIWYSLPRSIVDNSAITWAAWPSLLHAAGFSFISYGILRRRKHYIAAFWVVVNLLFELTQTGSGLLGYTSPGAFHVMDIVASLVGAGLFLLIINRIHSIGYDASTFSQNPGNHRLQQIIAVPIFFFGIFSISGSYEIVENCEDGCNPARKQTPVYMSYEQLRGPLRTLQNRPLKNPGKIYLYQHYLLINEPNEGIHIYDNSDVSNPVSLGFIVLPGNLDIAVRDGILYADSFIDLVAIDLSDPEDIAVVKRIENIFPYDPYQAIGRDADIYFVAIDESQGVVVGHADVEVELWQDN